MAASLVALCLALALGAPLWLLALGPIVLGIPHLLADLRYCGLRTGLLTRPTTLAACGLPLLATSLGAGLWIGLIAVAAAFALARGKLWRRGLGVALSLVISGLAYRHDITATLVMAHAHNFIGVLMWWGWRKRPASHALPVVALVGVTILVLSGGSDSVVMWGWGPPGSGLSRSLHIAQLAPELSPIWASRWVLLYAFAQSLHYGVWLHLIRDDDRRRPTPRTFRASYRELVAEFRFLPLVLAFLLCFGLAAWALVDLTQAREGYFRFAQFHGSLELCACALLIIEGRKW